MAQSGHTETICYLSAFGAERTLSKPPARPIGQHRFDRHRSERLAVDVEIAQTGNFGSDIPQ
jgi:hypothetical protein